MQPRRVFLLMNLRIDEWEDRKKEIKEDGRWRLKIQSVKELIVEGVSNLGNDNCSTPNGKVQQKTSSVHVYMSRRRGG